MLEGTLGTLAVVIGTCFLILLSRAGWLSVRRAESWFAVGLMVFGLWFLWFVFWSHLHTPRTESNSPSRPALDVAFRTSATVRLRCPETTSHSWVYLDVHHLVRS